MRSRARGLALGVGWAVVAPVLARADAPSISTIAEPSEVEIGEPFRVELSATVDASSAAPSTPSLRVPQTFQASGPSISTQTQFSLVNGRMSHRTGITATWRVLASKEGIFTIPGPTVTWNGTTLTGNPVRVTVVPTGGSPRVPRGGRRPTANPFDPFGMFPQLPRLFDDPSQQLELPGAPSRNPELALEHALDPTVFLRAVSSSDHAVVGEQVTLSIYLYARGGALEMTDVHEPAVPDFFRRDLLAPSDRPESEVVVIDGTAFRAQLIFRIALFPLKPGDLVIGAMEGTILGTGRAGNGVRNGQVRQTSALSVHVSEPTQRGRPPGYQIGDVGHFTLSATVEPRSAEVGGAVAVTATVQGTGNPPSALGIPLQTGVEWLDPQTRETITVEGAKIQGTRTFTYLLHPKAPGTVDLGVLKLPYYNPEQRAYQVAQVALGKLVVAPSSQPAAAEDVPPDPFLTVGAARPALTSFPARSTPWSDRWWFWAGVFGLPLGLFTLQIARQSFGRWRFRRSAEKTGAAARVAQSLRGAEEAVKRGDTAAASHMERAIHAALEERTGLLARGVLLEQLAQELERAGLDSSSAALSQALLVELGTVRYAASPPALPSLLARTRELLQQLQRGKPRRGRTGAA